MKQKTIITFNGFQNSEIILENIKRKIENKKAWYALPLTMYGYDNTAILKAHSDCFDYINILYSIYWLTNEINNVDLPQKGTTAIYAEEYNELVEYLEAEYEVLCEEIQHGFGGIFFTLNSDEKISAESFPKFRFSRGENLLKIIMYFTGLSKLYLRKIKPIDKVEVIPYQNQEIKTLRYWQNQ